AQHQHQRDGAGGERTPGRGRDLLGGHCSSCRGLNAVLLWSCNSHHVIAGETKQSISPLAETCFVASLPCANTWRLSQAMTEGNHGVKQIIFDSERRCPRSRRRRAS